MTVRTITEIIDVFDGTQTKIRVGPWNGNVELEIAQTETERQEIRVELDLEDARALVAGLTEAIRAAEASEANDG